MIKRLILVIILVVGMSTLLPQPADACDVATIEKPKSRQTLYFEPIEILVQFKDGANPKTFKAWLNSRRNNITDRFEPVENGMRALIGPEDGLRIYEKGEKYFRRANKARLNSRRNNKTDRFEPVENGMRALMGSEDGLRIYEKGEKYFRGANFLITRTRSESGKIDRDFRFFRANKGGDQNTVIVTILQTSDLHHHASGYGPFLDYTPLDTSDNDGITGGYARIATLVKEIREEQADYDIPVMLFDSGDFLMGTVYDMTASDPIAFRFFSLLGYDAITLGNHEFDWSPAGLAMLLWNAKSQGFSVPVLATNTITDETDPSDNDIEGLMATGDIVDKKIIELPNGLKVGLLGQMGPAADVTAPAAPPITFNHDYSFIQSQVDELRSSDEARLVIVLSHGGIHSDGMGDDAELADNVSGIDIIASGHYHTATHEAFNRSGTIIFSPGKYGDYLSRLDIAYNLSKDSIVDSKFTLIPVDDSILGDPSIEAMVELYQDGINVGLSPLGVQLGTPVSSTSFDLEMMPFQVTGLGSLCSDSVRNVANAVAPFNYPDSPIDVGIVTNGVIRDSIYQGNSGVITFTDVYNCMPLGISPYQTSPPGYPLMHVYLNGREIYTVCEVGLSLSQAIGSDDYYLNFSGIKIDYNPSGAPTGVQAVYLYAPNDPFCTGDANLIDISVSNYDPDKLYHIVVDFYALQMLNVIAAYGFPLLPKDADGFPIDPADYSNFRIDADPADGVQELKEWMALLNYLPGLGGSIHPDIYGPEGVVMGRVNFVEE